jgi:hypothetical protein
MAVRKLTREEQLKKAHMPSAMAFVSATVSRELTKRFGAKPALRRNTEAWEQADATKLTPDTVWSIASKTIDDLDILEDDRRELRKIIRDKFQVNKMTLDALNVALGGREHGMSSDYYGEG